MLTTLKRPGTRSFRSLDNSVSWSCFGVAVSLKNRKLAPRWIGPFRVLERIGNQAYRIALPNSYSRLHDVFPIQLLERYRRRKDDDSLMTMPELEDPRALDEWEVEEVLDKRKIKDTIHYLVKWTGWPSEYNSYEPANHLENAPQAITAYENKLKRKRSKGGNWQQLLLLPLVTASYFVPLATSICASADGFWWLTLNDDFEQHVKRLADIIKCVECWKFQEARSQAWN